MASKPWMFVNDTVGKAFYKLLGGKKSWRPIRENEFEALKGSKGNKFLNKKLKVRAITLGSYVFYNYGGFDEETSLHEQEHIEQAKTFGPIWFLIYGSASLIAFLSGKDYYEDNFFEKEARKKEDNTNESV